MKNDFEDLTYGGLVALIMVSLFAIFMIVASIIMWSLMRSGVDVMEWLFPQLKS